MTRSTYSKADGFIRVPYEEGVLLAEQLRHYADFLRTAGLTEEAADANFSAYAFEQAKEDPGELRWETRPFFKFKTVHLASSEKGGEDPV